MIPNYPWVFEPCSTEDVCDPAGNPWSHAVRGRKPQRPPVVGYGHTEGAADFDARAKASQQDAREVLGERGEMQLRMTTRWADDHYMITVYDLATGDALVQGQLVVADFYVPPPISCMLGLGSASWNKIDDWHGLDMMPMGT